MVTTLGLHLKTAILVAIFNFLCLNLFFMSSSFSSLSGEVKHLDSNFIDLNLTGVPFFSPLQGEQGPLGPPGSPGDDGHRVSYAMVNV